MVTFVLLGSGCGSIGRAFASNHRGPGFKCSHQQIFMLNTFSVNCWNDENKGKRGREWPFFDKHILMTPSPGLIKWVFRTKSKLQFQVDHFKAQFCFCGEGSFYSFLWYPWEREREEIVFISWTRVVPFPSPISQLSHSNVIRCFPFLAMMHTCSCSTHRTTSLKYYASIIIERQLVCFKLCIFTNLTSTGLYSKSSEALGERTGLVVIGGDSCTDDRGFESQHRILDGHIFTYICTINFNVDN